MQIQFKRAIPVIADTEVLVVGGGLGGIASALAAARTGTEVTLIEANGFLGGVATAGMCCSVFNCLFTKSRTAAIGGIPKEIVATLAEKAGGPGKGWINHKGHIIYDVEKAKLVLYDLLADAGVRIRLNTMAADVIAENESIQALIICGKNGLEAITCKMLIDATGDCDVVAQTGALFNYPQNGSKSSFVFRLGNVDVDSFVNYFRNNPNEYPEHMDIDWTVEEALSQYDETGTFLFPHGGGMQLSKVKEAERRGDLPTNFGLYDSLDAMQMHLIKDIKVCHVITGFTRTKSLDSESLTRSIADGRKVAFLFLSFIRKYLPGFENAFVSATADDLGIRGSRSIISGNSFTKTMKETPYRCDDAVGIGVVEKHQILNSGTNAWSAQVFEDEVYEFPLSCLIPKGWKNLIIGAGRGADTNPPRLLRVMVTTMAVGQGAGIAAAIAIKQKENLQTVDYHSIRSELNRQGVVFP